MTDLVGERLRKGEDVSMLRHDHVGEEQEVMLASRLIESIDEPVARPILGEELVPMVTRKSQLMGMTRMIKAPSPMSN